MTSHKLILLIIALVLLPLFCCLGCGSDGPSYADVVFKNGTIYLDMKNLLTTNALALRSGVVVAIGNDALKMVGLNTKVVDLNGAYAYPGFNDNHIHATAFNFSKNQLVLLDVKGNPISDMPTLKAKVKTYVDANPDITWIIGAGWSLPTDQAIGTELDDVTGDKILFIFDNHGHTALTNTAGLKLANITSETPDPQGGQIVKDSNGNPTGWLKEAAMSLLGKKLQLTYDMVSKGLLETLQVLAAKGLTSITDIAGVPGISFANTSYFPEFYTDLEKQGKLPMRVFYYIPIFQTSDIDMAVNIFMNDPGKNTEMVRCAGGKIWVDGAFFNGDGWTTFAHFDKPCYYGIYYFTEDLLASLITHAEEHSLPMQYHATGDKAIDIILTTLEKIQKSQGKLKARHVIAHANFLNPEFIGKMKELGMAASAQPNFWSFMQTEEAAHKAYGSYMNSVLNFGQWIDLSLPVAMGTDYTAARTPFPIENMSYGFTPPSPDHRALTPQEMIRGYSEGSAFSLSQEEVLGKLSPGYKADIVVLDKEALNITTADEFKKLKVLQTWIGGKQITSAQ